MMLYLSSVFYNMPIIIEYLIAFIDKYLSVFDESA